MGVEIEVGIAKYAADPVENAFRRMTKSGSCSWGD